MENDTTISKEGLLEPVLPGSVTFENSILGPLRNNYLYEESKESFTYNSAQLINNASLQERYSAFRVEKRVNGYSEEELKESFGFLLLDDNSRANRLADTGLIVGKGKCTTLGDCSKGVYISKYSDCLDIKRWYDGKTGYIVLLKLTKGRVKEVTENYTQKFTPPTAGFDCHISEQLRAVSASTSSFLAFERTQYYLYELLGGEETVEPCPRHVCPFAIVAFSYGKTAISVELKEKSQEKSSFHYQPWSGQLKIESRLFNIGLKSIHGAMFPANLPKLVEVGHAIGVSELRKILPQAVFETSPHVSLGGKWFSMYSVNSSDARNDLAFLTQELKEKDMALVICLEDGGFLVFLHSSNFLSFEGSSTDKAFGLQAMFIYPDSRAVPRDTKSGYFQTKVSSEALQVLPALNYAELEMEKSPPKQHEEPLVRVEKHLQNFAALIFPGLTNSPIREASMFPDQYDVPNGFPLISPKWTEQTGDRLRTYLGSPLSFQIPMARALELLAAGKQQRSDDHDDDDGFYYISSPEAPQTPADVVLERDLPKESCSLTCRDVSDHKEKAAEQQAVTEKTVVAELPCWKLVEEVSTPGAAVVTTPDNNSVERTDPSPTSGDTPTEHYAQGKDAVNTAQDNEETSKCVIVDEKCSGEELTETFTKETIQTTCEVLSATEIGDEAFSMASNNEMEVDHSEKVDSLSDSLRKVGGQIPPVADKTLQEADLPTSISPPTTSVNRTEALTQGCNEVQTEESSNPVTEMTKSTPKRRKRRKRKALKRKTNTASQITTPPQNTTSSLCSSAEATPDQSGNSDTTQSPQSILKGNLRSLPRRKKHWNDDARTTRTLRSDLKNIEMPSGNTSETQKNGTITERHLTSTTTRKKEGINMRERYGLKNIITDCGFVFVPHGSEVAPGDLNSNENKPADDSTNSLSGEKLAIIPAHEKPQPSELENRSQHMPLTHIQNITMNPIKTLSSGDITEMDPTSPKNSVQSSGLESTGKNKTTAKGHVYRAISISKLKTVLKRAKRNTSPATQDPGKSASDSTEPERKKGKINNDVASPDNGKLTVCEDDQAGAEHCNPESTENQELEENTPSKLPLRTTSSQEKQISKIPKENGFNYFDNNIPNEILKQTNQHLISDAVKSRVEGKRISYESQSSKEESAVGASVPSDALNLLADLALSVNSDKLLPVLGEKNLGTKTGSSPQKVIHLLRDLAPKLKLPPKSPFPEGLVVTGDLILEISKEHSYSQPTSLLSGLAGFCPQVQPTLGCIESHLSMKYDILKLPDFPSYQGLNNKGGKNGWRVLPSLSESAPATGKIKVRSSTFLSCRSIIEKDESIQVTRQWKEKYDFKFDSKFTNDKLDKCVTRALHSKWDFSIEDTFEQVHLIFHMWIGLFYSKPTSRFFHFDQNDSKVERKNPTKVLQCAIQTSTPLPCVDLTSNEDKPTAKDPVSDALDLSVKASEDMEHCTTGENPTPSFGTQESSELMRENNEAAIRSSLDDSLDVLSGSVLMDYRSTVEALEENSTPDYYNSSDIEDDTADITESPYTKLLESNSAYNQLCDHASNMTIDEKLSNEKNDEPARKDLSTSNTTILKRTGMTGAEIKNVAVFHQVVVPVRPVILSNTHDSLPGRKIILKSLSFKDTHKDETPVSVHSESLSKGEQSDMAVHRENRQRTPLRVYTRNKNKYTPKTMTRKCPVISVPGSKEIIEAKSVLPTRDEPPKAIFGGNSSTQEKALSDDETFQLMCNDIADIPMAVSSESNKTEHDVKSATDEASTDLRNDMLVEIHAHDDATVRVGPVPDVQDEIPVDLTEVEHQLKDEIKPVNDTTGEIFVDNETKDKETLLPVTNETSIYVPDAIKSQGVVETEKDHTSLHVAGKDTHVGMNVNNDTTRVSAMPNIEENDPNGVSDEDNYAADEVHSVEDVKDMLVDVLAEANDKLGVMDDMPIDDQDVSITNMEAKLEPDVRPAMSTDVHDVNNTNKEASTGLDVGDGIPASIQDVSPTKCHTDVRDCSSVDTQHDVEKTVNEKTNVMEEHMSGKGDSNTDEITHERERKVIAEPSCDVDIELNSEEQSTFDKSQDCGDMDISDKGSEDKTQQKVHEVNVSGDEIPSKALDEDTAKLQETNIKPEAQVAGSSSEHKREDAQSELSDYLPAAQPNSTSDQLISLNEGHNSPALNSPCISSWNENESPEFHDAVGDQHESPCSLDPTICEGSAAEKVMLHDSFDSMDTSSSALQIDTETELNSRCCTPTLDEPAYSQGTDEVSNVHEGILEEISEMDFHCAKKSPTNTWLVLDSSEDSHSELERSPAHKAELCSPDPSSQKYDTTNQGVDEGEPFSHDEHITDENLDYFDYEAIPIPTNNEEIEPHRYQFGSYSVKNKCDSYEELPSAWTCSAGSQTVEENDLGEWYAPDEDTHYTKNISIHRELAYRPREITECYSDISAQEQRIHYSKSTVAESNERALSFGHQTRLPEANDDSQSYGSEPVHYGKKKRKRRFCQNDWDEEGFNVTVDYNIQKTFSCSSDQSSISRTRGSSPYQRKRETKQSFDWRRYFKREGIVETNEEDDGPFRDPPSSIITMIDKKGNKVIFESPSVNCRFQGTPSQSGDRQQSTSDIQSLLEFENLIFSEKMTYLLKNSKITSKVKPQHRQNINPVENPMTVQFSKLDEENSFSAHEQSWKPLPKLSVDMSERKALKKTFNFNKPLYLQRLFCEGGNKATCSKISDITDECSKSYRTMMNAVCIGKTIHHQNEELKRKRNTEHTAASKQSGFCGRIKKDMFDHLHDSLNSIVRQACKTKYKFYILVTSADPFFEETRVLLEAEGHSAVEPYEFDFDSNGQTPLLIIVRNEDIAEHIFEVPHLLELKKSPRVLFAGIDQPSDIVNLTHQELFAKGGFVVFDETTLDTLNLENMKKIAGIMEELDKKGKWKWFLHYRDSRKLRENTRCSPEARRKKQFIDCCQEAGIVEVLPYHECDIISRVRPDYLRCLVRLQIHNVSSRFPVFITDTPDDCFEKNGILTMNSFTFSRLLSKDTCSVS